MRITVKRKWQSGMIYRFGLSRSKSGTFEELMIPLFFQQEITKWMSSTLFPRRRSVKSLEPGIPKVATTY